MASVLLVPPVRLLARLVRMTRMRKSVDCPKAMSGAWRSYGLCQSATSMALRTPCLLYWVRRQNLLAGEVG